ncbi:sensor domain-containing diguanylate cyclase [Nocardia alba]|uniref:PAS domain S-box-containing protein/diguanylate cyclase (GGDEF)-like protein n=1 Tax=Nocardia alba TaxID=225051 RepID=A0A4R1FRH5_9NOCA|nr:sensor domain-containing diguanylate cyclase [Nocardia alba]TCJ97547.1 PAS domain S-box-containing protein/diguanylate cyclase (GGDEF)-like protein [Nocardia alba]
MPARRFAQQWAAHLSAVTLTTLEQERLVEALESLLDRLMISMTGPCWDLDVAETLGSDLAELGFNSPDAVEASLPTLRAVYRHLDADPDLFDRFASRFGFGVGRRSVSSPVTPSAADGFEVAFRHASVAMSIGDAEGRIIDANPAFERLMGHPLDLLRGLDGFDLAGEEADLQRRRVIAELASTESGTVRFEISQPGPDGTMMWVAWTVTQCRSANGERTYLLGFGQDLTEHHAAAEQLQWQADHDPLTGLSNRRHLHAELRALITAAEPAERAAICALDVDGFKAVNDTYGHLVGDQILVELAERLQQSLGSDGKLLTRLGGDEFIVVLPPPSVHHIRETICLLRGAVNEPFTMVDTPLSVSVSIGAIVTPLTDLTVHDLLARADACLYEAKALGSNRWVLRTECPTASSTAPESGPAELGSVSADRGQVFEPGR